MKSLRALFANRNGDGDNNKENPRKDGPKEGLLSEHDQTVLLAAENAALKRRGYKVPENRGEERSFSQRSLS